MTPDENFSALNLRLPPAPKPIGVYRPFLIDGNHCYVSGHGTLKEDGTLIKGRVGNSTDEDKEGAAEGADKNLSVDEAKAAAQQVGLAILSTLKQNLGSLNKIKRVIKVLGMVNCTSDFMGHPHVINGCSELFAKVWGDDNGIGVRSSVGMGSLPDNIPVEIEAMFELV